MLNTWFEKKCSNEKEHKIVFYVRESAPSYWHNAEVIPKSSGNKVS